MTQLKPIENLFAVDLPGGLLMPEFSFEKSLIDIIHGRKEDSELVIRHTLKQCGSPIDKITIDIPPGSYEILFTTSNATEQQAAGVVERQANDRNSIYPFYYRDYEKPIKEFSYGKAAESLQSLLRSNGLDLSKNYLLIKKTT